MSIQLSGADIIDLAIRTEVRGEGFYREAAQAANTPQAKELFTYLADEELRHKRLFRGLSGAIVMTEIDPAAWDEAVAYIAATVDQAFFAKSEAPIRLVPLGATVQDMTRKAIEFEKQTLLYFYSLRDLVHPSNVPIVDKVIQEEKRHVRQLSAMLG
jgi:rubrerythrin